MARGRRTDHSRGEIADLITAVGAAIVAAGGTGDLSAREIARRIGYSTSTVISVAGGAEDILVAINTRTFGLWADAIEARLAEEPADRLAALVDAYFDFATGHRLLWGAIFEHGAQPPRIPLDQEEARGRLTGIVVRELEAALDVDRGDATAAALARSLIATVHGHCAYALSGSFALMGETNPRGAALERVREGVEAARR